MNEATAPTAASTNVEPPITKLTAIGAVVAVASIVIWGALRAYTGIFLVLNVRVFVGAFVMAAPLITVFLLSKESKKPAVVALETVLCIAVIAGGEMLGSLLAGKPPVWDKFSLVFLLVGAVLPWAQAKKLV